MKIPFVSWKQRLEYIAWECIKMIDDDVGQRKFALCMRSHFDKFERLYYQDKENGNAMFTPCL